jgi:PKD repeat protein
MPEYYAGGYINFLDKTLGTVEEWNGHLKEVLQPVSVEQNPVVQYNNPGKYKVTLKAKNSVNSSTKEKEGYVYVVLLRKLVLYLPFDGDNKDAGPNQLNPEELTAGAGSSVYNSQARFSGEVLNVDLQHTSKATSKIIQFCLFLKKDEESLYG